MTSGIYIRTEKIRNSLKNGAIKRHLNITKEDKQRISRKGTHWKLSDETKLKQSKSKKGKNHPMYNKRGKLSPFWIKDRTKLKKSENKMLDYAYKNWSKCIKKRDNWKCKLFSQECNGRLESHHIYNWIDYPELRYIINNGITLCAFHHPRGREEEKRMIPILQELLSVSKE